MSTIEKPKPHIYEYIMISLALLVPVPGRLSYGLVLILEMNLLMLTGTLFCRFIHYLHFDALQDMLVAVFLIFMSVLFKQFIILYSPLVALTLGFQIYLPAVSSFILGNLYEAQMSSLLEDVKKNMLRSGEFSLFAFIMFLFRDLFGYGSISLPYPKGVLELIFIKDFKYSFIGAFWASIPGALMFTALVVILLSHIENKFDIIKTIKSEEEDAE